MEDVSFGHRSKALSQRKGRRRTVHIPRLRGWSSWLSPTTLTLILILILILILSRIVTLILTLILTHQAERPVVGAEVVINIPVVTFTLRDGAKVTLTLTLTQIQRQ